MKFFENIFSSVSYALNLAFWKNFTNLPISRDICLNRFLCKIKWKFLENWAMGFWCYVKTKCILYKYKNYCFWEYSENICAWWHDNWMTARRHQDSMTNNHIWDYTWKQKLLLVTSSPLVSAGESIQRLKWTTTDGGEVEVELFLFKRKTLVRIKRW